MTNRIEHVLENLGICRPEAILIGDEVRAGRGAKMSVRSPIGGELLAEFDLATPDDLHDIVQAAQSAFAAWRTVPAPRRGELVRRFGEALRQHKEDLAALVTWEAGKITQEALGEVQEMIDICDYAVGLSRQLYGLTIASERPEHRLMEQWHSLGPIGVISAFNFPVAVWAWNASLALVCGDSLVWKPSEKTPLCALACQRLLGRVCRELGDVPLGLSNVIVGKGDVGGSLAADPGLPLISATGSVAMGRAVAQVVAARLGRCLLELGGNNAMIVCPSADQELALRAIVFSAVGTCGQRCTTLRRLLIHEDIADAMIDRLRRAYADLPIGDPRQPQTLVGPLIDEAAVGAMNQSLVAAQSQGGRVLCGGQRLRQNVPAGGVYVAPAIVQIGAEAQILRKETFAPILYLIRYRDFERAIEIQNDVPQGLASAVFTRDLLEAEKFCSVTGSDCGIANVNIGTSGAEIGGAFGGEKETGGGRESGSDAWKAYMRRATNTINYSLQLPLAQGIRFGE
jgi:aldehyde dehydrogenase (NAD+)